MKVFFFVVWCIGHINNYKSWKCLKFKSHKQQHNFCTFNMWVWKMWKLLYKTQLHGQRSLEKRNRKWEKACIDSRMWHWKCKTLFQSKVIMVEKTLEFKNLPSSCLTKRKRCHFNIKKYIRPMCGFLDRWHIILNTIVPTFVMNQF